MTENEIEEALAYEFVNRIKGKFAESDPIYITRRLGGPNPDKITLRNATGLRRAILEAKMSYSNNVLSIDSNYAMINEYGMTGKVASRKAMFIMMRKLRYYRKQKANISPRVTKWQLGELKYRGFSGSGGSYNSAKRHHRNSPDRADMTMVNIPARPFLTPAIKEIRKDFNEVAKEIFYSQFKGKLTKKLFDQLVMRIKGDARMKVNIDWE